MDLGTTKSLLDSMNPTSMIGTSLASKIKLIVEQQSMRSHYATSNYEAKTIKLYGKVIDGIKKWMNSSNPHINW